MKYIGLTLLSIVWLLSTFLLAISIIGTLVFFIEDENDEIYWCVYGRKLIHEMSA
jgi:ABC-type transport system involved in multi-copper enzyme maturation permease subunit